MIILETRRTDFVGLRRGGLRLQGFPNRDNCIAVAFRQGIEDSRIHHKKTCLTLSVGQAVGDGLLYQRRLRRSAIAPRATSPSNEEDGSGT